MKKMLTLLLLLATPAFAADTDKPTTDGIPTTPLAPINQLESNNSPTEPKKVSNKRNAAITAGLTGAIATYWSGHLDAKTLGVVSLLGGLVHLGTEVGNQKATDSHNKFQLLTGPMKKYFFQGVLPAAGLTTAGFIIKDAFKTGVTAQTSTELAVLVPGSLLLLRGTYKNFFGKKSNKDKAN